MLGAVSQPSVVHDEDNSSATVSHVDTVEKTTLSKHKPKFPCKLCEGDHLSYKCPSIEEVRRFWFHGHPIFEHPTQPLVDQAVEPISDLVDSTLLSKSDPDVIEPIPSLVNPTLPMESDFDEVVESISVLINPTLPLESEVSSSHIFFNASS